MAEKPTPKTQRELSSEIAINAALPSAQNHHQNKRIVGIQEHEKMTELVI